MQSVKTPQFERDLRIAADISRLKDAREWAGEAAENAGLDEDGCFQVKLAMSEAVTNAILHGSGSAQDQVELGVREEEKAIVFEVRDSAGREPTSEDWVKRVGEGGRGLELISLMMDEVQLTRGEGGSVLRFSKSLAA
jgi:anti-sigma regulatory factor (Ser/Thr protein kinase)